MLAVMFCSSLTDDRPRDAQITSERLVCNGTRVVVESGSPIHCVSYPVVGF